MYRVDIDYHSESSPLKSGYMAGYDTLEQAKKELERMVKYYTIDCPRIIDTACIMLVCDKCLGVGEIVKHNKRNRLMYKRLPCPSCKGKAESLIESWEVCKP